MAADGDSEVGDQQQHQPVSCTSCLHRLFGRRIRNESIFVMSLIQALCSLAALILSAVATSREASAAAATTASSAASAAGPGGYSQCGMASLASSALIMAVAGHGIATSRCKRYCTVLALFVLCQLACLASLVLLGCSGASLHTYFLRSPQPYLVPASASEHSQPYINYDAGVSDLVTSALTMLLSLMELGVALSCCLACGRQLRLRDPRIVLDPGGNGLVIAGACVAPGALDDFQQHQLCRYHHQCQHQQQHPFALLPPPPPFDFESATPPPAYSTIDRRWRRRGGPGQPTQPPPDARPVSADPDLPPRRHPLQLDLQISPDSGQDAVPLPSSSSLSSSSSVDAPCAAAEH